MGGPTLRGLVVVGLLVVLAAATGTAAADAAAQSSNVTAERVDAGMVEVGVTAAWFDASAKNATANVSVPAANASVNLTADAAASDDTTYVFRASVANLSVRGVDLADARLLVAASPDQSGNDTADLRRLTVSGDEATLDAETQTLRLNASQALGVPDGAPVPVALTQGQSTTRINATLDLGDGGTQLNLTDLSSVSPFGASVTVTPYPDTSYVAGSGATVMLTDVAETVLEWRDGEVVLANALLREGKPFVLDVETSGPAGQYVAEHDAGDGYVSLPERLTRADSLTVSFLRDGDAVLSGISPKMSTTGTAATIQGSNVTFETSLPADLQSVWVDNGDLQKYRNVSASGQTLTFAGANSLAVGQNLLVVGAEDILRASVMQSNRADTQPQGQQIDGALPELPLPDPVTVLWLVIGVLLGVLIALGYENLGWAVLFPGSIVTILPWGIAWLFAEQMSFYTRIGVYANILGAMAGFAALLVMWNIRPNQQRGSTSSSVGGAAPGRSEQQKRSVTIRVVDGLSGNTIQEQVDVRIVPEKGQAKIRAVDGERKLKLGASEYSFKVTHGGRRATASIPAVRRQHSGSPTRQGRHSQPSQRGPSQGPTTTNQNDRTVTLELPPHDVKVKVTDDDTGRPVRGASVTLASKGNEQSASEVTDERGTCSRRISAQVDSVTVSVEADRYEPGSKSVSLTEESQTVRVALTPKTGRAEATASLGGDPVPELSVRFEPLNDGPAESRTAETGADGTATVEGLRVGRYELRAELPTDAAAFSVSTEPVRVRDGGAASARLDVSFAYSLGTDQRDRMDELDERLDSLSSVARRDTAVPYFYASAVRELLATARSVPDEGLALLTAETDPDAVVTALLDAAELATEAVEDTMASKRNVDLFTACSDLPDVTVEYDERVALADVLDLATEDRAAQLDRVDDRLRAIDDRIADERSDLSEVSPARQMWEATRDLIREDRPADPLASAALLVAAETLLNAIEALFEDDALRERMTRTVF